MNPLRVVRILNVHPPIAAPADQVLGAVAERLRQEGCDVRVLETTVEFGAPASFGVAYTMGRAAARMLGGGTATLDPAAPDRRICLELRFGIMSFWPVGTLGTWLLLGANPFDLESTAGVTLLAAAVWWINYMIARSAYEMWVLGGAHQARGKPRDALSDAAESARSAPLGG
jgi:hypothetical protein